MELTQKQIINRIYQDICGFEIPKGDEQLVKKSKGSPVYGEITVRSTEKLFTNLGLSARDTLYDLGSGVGKVVLFAGLFTPVKRAIGVELSQIRHEESTKALERACALQRNLARRCQFLNDDLLNVDLSKATVVYTCSTAFSQDFMRKLTGHLGQFTHDFRLISLQDLPNEKYFELCDKMRLDMSWQRSTPVFIYKRR